MRELSFFLCSCRRIAHFEMVSNGFIYAIVVFDLSRKIKSDQSIRLNFELMGD